MVGDSRWLVFYDELIGCLVDPSARPFIGWRVSLINLCWSAFKSFRVWYFQTLHSNIINTRYLRKAQWLIWLTYVSQVILRESSYLTWVKLSYVSHAILRESRSSRRTYVRNYIVFSKNNVSHAILRESSCLAWIKLSYVSQVILLYVCTQLGWLTRTFRRLFLPKGIIYSHFVRKMYQSWEWI